MPPKKLNPKEEQEAAEREQQLLKQQQEEREREAQLLKIREAELLRVQQALKEQKEAQDRQLRHKQFFKTSISELQSQKNNYLSHQQLLERNRLIQEKIIKRNIFKKTELEHKPVFLKKIRSQQFFDPTKDLYMNQDVVFLNKHELAKLTYPDRAFDNSKNIYPEKKLSYFGDMPLHMMSLKDQEKTKSAKSLYESLLQEEIKNKHLQLDGQQKRIQISASQLEQKKFMPCKSKLLYFDNPLYPQESIQYSKSYKNLSPQKSQQSLGLLNNKISQASIQSINQLIGET